MLSPDNALTPAQGETVIDLGSGGGFDAFLASQRVGPEGRVIGVDRNKVLHPCPTSSQYINISKAMLSLAQANQTKSRAAANVTFVEASLTSIPLPSGSADCIISNCVINLVPQADKGKAFQEMGRLLRSGGRVAISDTLARKAMPDNVRNSVALYVGCIAGCSEKAEYERWLAQAGFTGELNACVWKIADAEANSVCL
jgi:arsenite methyltransferase